MLTAQTSILDGTKLFLYNWSWLLSKANAKFPDGKVYLKSINFSIHTIIIAYLWNDIFVPFSAISKQLYAAQVVTIFVKKGYKHQIEKPEIIKKSKSVLVFLTYFRREL